MAETSGENASDFEVAEYCGRLSCHQVIVQPSGRGRRREFCSETCRRGADRDYKRAKSMVEHFEAYLEKTRHEVAAYGRKSDEGLLTPEQRSRQRALAYAAFSRAEAVVEFAGDSGDRYLIELTRLVDAVRPLVQSGVARPDALVG